MNKLTDFFCALGYAFILAVLAVAIFICFGFIAVLTIALPVLVVLNVIGLTAFSWMLLLRILEIFFVSFYVLAFVYITSR